ncbi:hypothetical protein P691DRAFT_808946 [Macrolepiota fuliginosa MF-IS2]|uniref:Uncharacterized protein n=1 Tax=Macrolepiota fuliginosa MF-IS2 TaxID=1400762 RepID=A0A9P6BXU2_9AGAR|nr:hypothetical protein P691DRAFT_808946 [Macrolepiota fuliginosa MF-IS2]
MRAATFPSIVSRTDWKVFKLWKAVEGVKNQEADVRENECVDAPDAHEDVGGVEIVTPSFMVVSKLCAIMRGHRDSQTQKLQCDINDLLLTAEHLRSYGGTISELLQARLSDRAESFRWCDFWELYGDMFGEEGASDLKRRLHSIGVTKTQDRICCPVTGFTLVGGQGIHSGLLLLSIHGVVNTQENGTYWI